MSSWYDFQVTPAVGRRSGGGAKGAAGTVAGVAPSSRKSTRAVPSAPAGLGATWPDPTARAERPANAGGAGGVPASAGGGPASAGGVPASAGEPPVEGSLGGGGAGPSKWSCWHCRHTRRRERPPGRGEDPGEKASTKLQA